MREGNVSRTQIVELPDTGDAAPHLVCTLNANHTGNPSSLECIASTCCSITVLEILRVFIDKPATRTHSVSITLLSTRENEYEDLK